MTLWIAGLVIFTTISQASGWQHCSKTKDPAFCLPCSKNGTDIYKCPRNCNEDIDVESCNIVCSNNCVQSECEYDDLGILKCLQGCISSFAGPYCQESCLDGCVKCTQDNQRCLQCEKGRFGELCDKKCSTCTNKSCDSNGSCTEGCIGGYFGPLCLKKCPPRCGQCDRDTGQCQACVIGWFGTNCQSECRNCKNKRCSFMEGVCNEGCVSGFKLQGKTCQKVVMDKPEDPAEEKLSGLAGIFQEEDYLLPVIGCLLVLLAIVAVVVVWRCRKSMLKEKEREKEMEKEKEKLEKEKDVEGQRLSNGFPRHPSLRRAITEIPKGDPLYKDVVEEAIRTHSCEEILKKHNLLDPNRPRLENKSLASLRNRAGNLSMPFMTPIEEDEEEVEDDDGVHMPNVGIIFTLDSHSEDETGGAVSDHFGTDIPEIIIEETDSCVDLPGRDSAGDLYIVQRGKKKDKGALSVSFDYMDSSLSGRSTPNQPEMYSSNPFEGEDQLRSKLSDHLDTFLSDRKNGEDLPLQNGRAGEEMDSLESDALLQSDLLQNNNNASKSRFGVPNKLTFFTGNHDKVIINGDTAKANRHISFSSERQPMLSHAAESSA